MAHYQNYAHFYINDRIFNECIFKNNQQKILVLLEYLKIFNQISCISTLEI